jgi:hypothetical protein
MGLLLVGWLLFLMVSTVCAARWVGKESNNPSFWRDFDVLNPGHMSNHDLSLESSEYFRRLSLAQGGGLILIILTAPIVLVTAIFHFRL